ncbi:MAG TPA: hypothetical protein VGL38_14895 [bacterium]
MQLSFATPSQSQSAGDNETQRLQAQITSLRQQMQIASSACRGEQVIRELQSRIDRLTAQWTAARGRGGEGLDQGGQTCTDARVISVIPFCDTGSTTTALNVFSPPSSCGGSNAPDAVYSYTPEATTSASVSLCGSDFNTILHIWNGCPGQPGSQPVACNDDGAACPPASCLPAVDFLAGNTYYIVVDGSGTEHGNYRLSIGGSGTCPVNPCPCPWTCPPNALLEPEPCPNTGPDVNAGCHGYPVLFTPISCGQTYCGTAPWTPSRQDFDAYSVTLTQRDSLRWCVYSKFAPSISVYQYFAAG